MKRREFIERMLTVGGLTMFQPWQLFRMCGDWDTIAEARSLLKNNIETFGTKLTDVSTGFAGMQSHGVGFGDAVWDVAEETATALIFPQTETKSIRITCVSPGSITSAYRLHYTINVPLHNIGRLMLPVYSTFKGGTIQTLITIAHDTSYANNLGYRFTHPYNDGWLSNIRLRYEPTETSGTVDINNTFVRVRIGIHISPGETGTIYVGSVYANSVTTTRVSIGFDDRPITEYTNAFPYMQSRGVVGSTAVISSSTSASHLTIAQLQEMQENGWSIHNHTHSHLNLPTLDETTLRDQLYRCKEYLQQHKLHESGKDVFVYPFGAFSDFVNQVLYEYYPVGAGVSGNSLGIWGFTGQILKGNIPINVMNRRSIDNPTAASTIIATVNSWIRYGVDGNLYGHNPSNSAINGHTELANLREIVDTLYRYKQAGLIRIVNLNEMVVGLRRSRLLRLPIK